MSASLASDGFLPLQEYLDSSVSTFVPQNKERHLKKGKKNDGERVENRRWKEEEDEMRCVGRVGQIQTRRWLVRLACLQPKDTQRYISSVVTVSVLTLSDD